MALVFQPVPLLPGGGYWFDDQTGDIDKTGRNPLWVVGMFGAGYLERPRQNAQTGVFEAAQAAPRTPAVIPPSGVGPGPTGAIVPGPGPAAPPPGGAGAAADQPQRGAPAGAPAGAAAGEPPALRQVDRVVGAYAGQHGNPVSLPAKSDEVIKDPADQLGLRTIPNPNPTFHYTFPDGFQLDITLNGEVIKETEPSAARTRATEPISGPGGTQWQLNPQTGQYEQVAPVAGTTGAAALQSQIGQNEAQAQYYTALAEKARAEARLQNAQTPSAAAKIQTEIEEINGRIELYAAQAFQARQTGAIAGLEVGPKIAQLAAETGLTNAQAERLLRMTEPEINELEARGELTREQAATARARRGPEVAQILATTRQIGATTDLTDAQAEVDRATAALKRATMPSDIALAQANVQAAYARIAQIAQEMNRPVPVTASTETPVVQYITPDGQIRAQRNEAFLPTTMAGVAALTGQLRGQGQQMADQLSQQVASGVLTREQADQRLNDWYQQNQPIAEQAQQQIQREQERLDMARREAAVTAAQGAGTQLISALQTQLPYMAGPGYGGAMASAINALGQGREVPEGTFRPEMFTGPPINIPQMAQQATMEALKLISPTAAQATGAPLPQMQGLDIGAMLGRTAYGSTALSQGWPGPAPQQSAPMGNAAQMPWGSPNMFGYGGQVEQQSPVGGVTINIGGGQPSQPTPMPQVPPPFIPQGVGAALPQYQPSPVPGFTRPGPVPQGAPLTPAMPQSPVPGFGRPGQPPQGAPLTPVSPWGNMATPLMTSPTGEELWKFGMPDYQPAF
jgi:hypothetical protein